MRLLPERRAVIGGKLKVDGQDVRALSSRDLSAYRTNRAHGIAGIWAVRNARSAESSLKPIAR